MLAEDCLTFADILSTKEEPRCAPAARDADRPKRTKPKGFSKSSSWFINKAFMMPECKYDIVERCHYSSDRADFHHRCPTSPSHPCAEVLKIYVDPGDREPARHLYLLVCHAVGVQRAVGQWVAAVVNGAPDAETAQVKWVEKNARQTAVTSRILAVIDCSSDYDEGVNKCGSDKILALGCNRFL